MAGDFTDYGALPPISSLADVPLELDLGMVSVVESDQLVLGECQWTTWFNTNQHLTTSFGDLEEADKIREQFPGALCAAPAEIEARDGSGLGPCRWLPNMHGTP